MSDNDDPDFPSQLAVTCGFCGDTNDVKWFCKWCSASMCNSCKPSHLTIPAFKNHIIVPRTNDVIRLYGPSKIAEQCRMHPEKEISTYCNECQEPCCVNCLVKSHKRHDISSIEDAYLLAEKRLNDNVKKLEKDVVPTLDNIADKTKKYRSEHKDEISRVREEVNAFRKEMKQAVDESCDVLLEKLDADDIELENFITRTDTQKRKVSELIKEIEGIIQKGKLNIIKYSPPVPETLIPEVPNYKLKIPFFTPGRDILTIIRERMGTIQWNYGSSGPKYSPIQIAKFDPSVISIVNIGSFTSEIIVSSITTAGNNTAWVMFWESETMLLYTGSGEVVKSITIKGSVGINDMVIRQSGEIIVTCRDNKVRRVSVSGEVSTLIDTSPFRPEGVCLTDSEEVVVCMNGQDEKNHVAVYSLDTGRKLREVRGIDGQGKQHITEPYRLAFIDKDLFVVNNHHRETCNAVCLDEGGYLKWVYYGNEAKLTNSFDPSGISVDKYNNLLVTDAKNDCLHYIDKEGRLIQKIMTKDQARLKSPWGIFVDVETGQVWVGGWQEIGSYKVIVLKYVS